MTVIATTAAADIFVRLARDLTGPSFAADFWRAKFLAAAQAHGAPATTQAASPARLPLPPAAQSAVDAAVRDAITAERAAAIAAPPVAKADPAEALAAEIAEHLPPDVRHETRVRATAFAGADAEGDDADPTEVERLAREIAGA